MEAKERGRRARLARVLAPALAALMILVLAAGLLPALAEAKSSESVVAVPNVRGKRQAEAERLLSEAGFDRIQVFEVDTDKRGLANVVKDQAPPAGREVSVGATIKLTVYRYGD